MLFPLIFLDLQMFRETRETERLYCRARRARYSWTPGDPRKRLPAELRRLSIDVGSTTARAFDTCVVTNLQYRLKEARKGAHMVTGSTLKDEQAAFDAQLDELLLTHPGKYVLFKDGRPVEFFDDYPSAYGAALKRYGLGEVFLIAPIIKSKPQPVSISWEAGVMIG